MAKKSKHATGKPFEVVVCDAIRHHIGERKALESKRSIAFEDRDAALADLEGLKNHNSPEYAAACKQHSEATRRLETLKVQIAWHSNQVDDVIEKADEPGFDFLYEMPDEPVVKPKPHPAAVPADDRPVGVPGKPKAGARSLVPEKPTGVDEHLLATVSELDIPDYLAQACVAKGYTTIGELAHAIDAGKSMQSEIGRGAENGEKIIKAVAKFRKKHRSAMVEVEREE